MEPAIVHGAEGDREGVEDSSPGGIPPRHGYDYQPLRESTCASTPDPGVRNALPIWPFLVLVGGMLAVSACFLLSSGSMSQMTSSIDARVAMARMACEGNHCTTFNCAKDKDDWVTKWSDTKKLYCCGMSCLAKSLKAKQGKLKGPVKLHILHGHSQQRHAKPIEHAKQIKQNHTEKHTAKSHAKNHSIQQMKPNVTHNTTGISHGQQQIQRMSEPLKGISCLEEYFFPPLVGARLLPSAGEGNHVFEV